MSEQDPPRPATTMTNNSIGTDDKKTQSLADLSHTARKSLATLRSRFRDPTRSYEDRSDAFEEWRTAHRDLLRGVRFEVQTMSHTPDWIKGMMALWDRSITRTSGSYDELLDAHDAFSSTLKQYTADPETKMQSLLDFGWELERQTEALATSLQQTYFSQRGPAKEASSTRSAAGAEHADELAAVDTLLK
jgi:hypothetical protein